MSHYIESDFRFTEHMEEEKIWLDMEQDKEFWLSSEEWDDVPSDWHDDDDDDDDDDTWLN